MIKQDLNMKMEKSIVSAKIEAERLFKKNAPPVTIFNVTTNLILEFLRIYFLKLAFLKGIEGLIKALYHSYEKAIQFTYLWEMQNTGKKN